MGRGSRRCHAVGILSRVSNADPVGRGRSAREHPANSGDSLGGRKRPADAVVGNRQLSACVLGLPYDRLWVESGRKELWRVDSS